MRGTFTFAPADTTLLPAVKDAAEKGAGAQDHRGRCDPRTIGEVDTGDSTTLDPKRGYLSLNDAQPRLLRDDLANRSSE